MKVSVRKTVEAPLGRFKANGNQSILLSEILAQLTPVDIGADTKAQMTALLFEVDSNGERELTAALNAGGTPQYTAPLAPDTQAVAPELIGVARDEVGI